MARNAKCQAEQRAPAQAEAARIAAEDRVAALARAEVERFQKALGLRGRGQAIRWLAR